MKPRCSRDFAISCGNVAASAMGGDSVMPFGSRHGPWTSPLTTQQRDRVEQQRRDHLVDAQADAQDARARTPTRRPPAPPPRPSAAARRAATSPRRTCPRAVAATAPISSCPSAPMFQ